MVRIQLGSIPRRLAKRPVEMRRVALEVNHCHFSVQPILELLGGGEAEARNNEARGAVGRVAPAVGARIDVGGLGAWPAFLLGSFVTSHAPRPTG
jgi:hypothetical protein